MWSMRNPLHIEGGATNHGLNVFFSMYDWSFIKTTWVSRNWGTLAFLEWALSFLLVFKRLENLCCTRVNWVIEFWISHLHVTLKLMVALKSTSGVNWAVGWPSNGNLNLIFFETVYRQWWNEQQALQMYSAAIRSHSVAMDRCGAPRLAWGITTTFACKMRQIAKSSGFKSGEYDSQSSGVRNSENSCWAALVV